MQNEEVVLIIEKYNQRGEGVGFYNQIPIYVFGTIKGEKVRVKIVAIHKKYMIGELIEIVFKSENRSNLNIPNAKLIGGYELIHMNDKEQINFKVEKIKNDFWKIANIKLNNLEIFIGKKRFKYRNKVVLHDGFFYQKNSHQKIEIEDFLLSDIKWNSSLKGEIIYRKLETFIFGTKNEKKYTYDQIGKYKFRVGLSSFYQINKEVMDVVYNEIKKFVIPNGVTLDLYSGIGTIGIFVSDISKKVYCVENNKNSFLDSLHNIEINEIKNVETIKANVDLFIKKVKNKKIDTLILDPSREGVNTNTMKMINSILPQRIIYLSCNPGTQAANFNHIKNNYKIIKSHFFDMFPQTYHIENLIICDLINKK